KAFKYPKKAKLNTTTTTTTATAPPTIPTVTDTASPSIPTTAATTNTNLNTTVATGDDNINKEKDVNISTTPAIPATTTANNNGDGTATTSNKDEGHDNEIDLTEVRNDAHAPATVVFITATTSEVRDDANPATSSAPPAPSTSATVANDKDICPTTTGSPRPITPTSSAPAVTTSATVANDKDICVTTTSSPGRISPTSSGPAATATNDKDVCLPATSSPGLLTATTTNDGNNNKDGDGRNEESNNLELTAAPATTTPSIKIKAVLNSSTILPPTDPTSNGMEDDNDEDNPTQDQEPQDLVLEDANLAQQSQPPAVLHVDATVSDDSSSLNRQQVVVDVPSAGNGAVKQGLEDRVRINLVSRSKQEVRELRRKLENELHLVRSLVKKIEAKQGELGVSRFDNPQMVVNNGVADGLRRLNSGVTSVGIPREVTSTISTPTPRQTRPLNQLSVSVLENSQGMGEVVEKEKRTPKANQFYRNSEFLLAKDKFPPAESNKKSKLNGKKHGAADSGVFGSGTKIYKQCTALLERLLKHKHAWVFDAPVDVKGLGLHDYFTIIKHPMDLGTVKTRLHKNWYKSPEEFAEDVRLTFHNAMRYNPKGQDVHVMAEEMLEIFEKKWAVMKLEYDREMRFASIYDMVPTPTPRKAPLLPPPPLDMRKILDRSESMTYPAVDMRHKPISTTPSGRTPVPKKPKAKDPHKRDMTYEEKQKLSTNLQSLPSEKLDNIVQIIKKRNSSLFQHDDEIEVDIDSVDAETLWELDRFVTNYKKSLSKNKRKAELAMARAEAQQTAQEKVPAPAVKKKMSPIHHLFKWRNKERMEVGQVVLAALAVIPDLLQAIQIVTAPRHLDLM
ncbi:hypothetical protein Tsubulata_038075, partial [Turnera subulata]